MKHLLCSLFLCVLCLNQTSAQGYQLFQNGNPVITTDGGVANWYPSIITVTGAQQYLSGLIVRIPQIYSSGDLGGLDLLLQSPSGTKVILHSDIRTDHSGNFFAETNYASDGFIRPDDYVFNGGYLHPVNNGSPTDIFPAPGPGAITQPEPTLAAFYNENPNGTWRLWMVDDTLDGVYTQLFNGWNLLVQTSPTPICPHPEPPNAISVTDSTALIAWHGNGPAVNWDIFVTRTDSFQFPGNPTIANWTEDTLLLTNLAPGTGYGIFVRSKCPNGTDSEWHGPAYFSTLFNSCNHTTPIEACQEVHCNSVPEYTIVSIETACGTGTPTWLFRFTPPETGPYYLKLNEFGSSFYWLPDTAATCPTSGWNCLQQVFPELDTIFVDTLQAGMSYLFFVQNNQQSKPVFSLSNCPLPPMGFGAGQIFTDSVVLSFGNVPALPLTDSLEVYFGPAPLAPPDAGTLPTPGIRIDRETGVATVGGLLPATTYAAYLRKRCDAMRTSCWQGPAEITTLQLCNKVNFLGVDTVTYSWAEIAFTWDSILPGWHGWDLRLCLPGQDPDGGGLQDVILNAVGTDTLLSRLENIPSYQPLQLYIKAACPTQDPFYQPWQGPFDIPAGQTPPVPIRDIYCGEENQTFPDDYTYSLNGIHTFFSDGITLANPCYPSFVSMGEKIFRYRANKNGQVRIVWNGGFGGNEGSGTGFFVKPASILPGNQGWTYLGCWKFGFGWDPALYELPAFDVQQDSAYYILCDGFDGTATHVPGNFPFFIGDCTVTCPKVDSITLVSATSTTATLRWNNSAPGGYYQLHYRPNSGTTGGGSLITTDTLVSLTGLNPSGEYVFFLRAFCSSSDASNLQTATFQLGDNVVFQESAFGRCNPRFLPPGGTGAANFEVFEVHAPADGNYLFSSTFYNSHIYTDAFDPNNPTENLLAAVRDYGPDGRKDTTLALETGKPYFWVVSEVGGGYNHEGNKNLRLMADGPAPLEIGPGRWNGREPGPHGLVPYLGFWWHSGVCADTAGWVHYYKTADDPNNLDGDRILLSVKTNLPVTQMDALPMVFSSFPGPVLVTSPPAIFFQNPDGIYEMNRIWLMQDLTPTQQIEQDFLVRFYYTQQEYQELKAAIESHGGKLENHEAMYFYKINGYHGYSNVSPWEHHIFVPAASSYDSPGYWPYTNGQDATASTWRHGLYGGEHYAETLIHGFSGGGGGATVNGKSVFDAVSNTKDWETNETGMIAPNPNTGFFTVKLKQATPDGSTLRIVEPAGRLVLEMSIEPGNMWLNVEAGNMPAGLYILQVISGGRTLAVDKFVKE